FRGQPHGQATQANILATGQSRLQSGADSEKQRLVADEDPTAIGLFDSRDIAQECRFARTVGTDDADHLTFSGNEVDPAQRPDGRLSLATEHRIADASQPLSPVTGVVGADRVADLDVLRNDAGVFELRADHSSPPL